MRSELVIAAPHRGADGHPPARLPVGAAVLAGVLCLGVSGCVGFDPQPLEPVENAAALEARSLSDAAVRAYVADTLDRSPALASEFAWDLDALMVAAFYFHPELDVARAQWAVAEAALVTAGQRPGAAIAVAPAKAVSYTGMPVSPGV